MTKSHSFLIYVDILRIVDTLGVYTDATYLNDAIQRVSTKHNVNIDNVDIASTTRIIFEYLNTHKYKDARKYIIEELKDLFFVGDIK